MCALLIRLLARFIHDHDQDDMDLDTALLRCDRYGSAYTRDLYFRGCALTSGVLFVPNRETGEMIARLFGADLKRVIPDLRITVQAVTAKPRPSAFKKGYEPVRLDMD